MEQTKPPYKNYEDNQKKILDALLKLADEENPFPSYQQISDKTKEMLGKHGISKRTVERHYKSLDFGYICERERIYTPGVVRSIGDAAKKGKARSQKLYTQLLEGYIERKDHKVEQAGELQVNANISGNLSVTIQRRLIRSREDLEALTELGAIVGQAVSSEKPLKPSAGDRLSDDVKDMIQKNIPVMVNNLDTMVFFKK